MLHTRLRERWRCKVRTLKGQERRVEEPTIIEAILDRSEANSLKSFSL